MGGLRMNLVRFIEFFEKWGLVIIVAPPLLFGWYMCGLYCAEVLFN